MSERIPEARAGETVLELEKGEKKLRDIRSDRGTFMRDHAVMAVLGMGVVGIVLALIGSDHVAIGSLGAVLAIGVRGAYLYSEQMKFHWILTDRRLVGPAGRSVYLLEVATVRRLFGDIQIITRAGDKHLVKHVAGSDEAVAAITAARDRRQRRKGPSGG